MSRAKWKGPVINLYEKKLNIKKSNFILSKRNCKITPKFLNKTLKIYNGKLYTDVVISEEMMGYTLGEFVFTRKKFSLKKKKTKK
jgi:ribosomal protein S19